MQELFPKVEPLYQAFAAALREKHGKLPVAGIPRITRFRKGQGRFTVVDPSGNSVIYVQREEPGAGEEWADPGKQSRLLKALDTAVKLRDFKSDDRAAAKVLDAALARKEAVAPVARARALAARAELAVAMGDAERAQAVRAELQQVLLSDEERERYRDELQAADDLERTQR